MYNIRAPYFMNGVPHQPPEGYDDEDFTYVLTPTPSPGGPPVKAGIQTISEQGGLQVEAVTAGVAGNSITFDIPFPVGNQALSIVVVGNAITVNIEVANFPDFDTCTIQAVVNAVNSDPQASALVLATVLSQPNGFLPPVASPLQLAGGANSTSGGTVVAASSSASFTFSTYPDAVFVWAGYDLTFFWDSAKLYLKYDGTKALWTAPVETQGVPATPWSPAPIVPPVHLPPGTQFQFTVENLNATAFSNLCLILRGFHRRAKIGAR